MNVTSVLVDWLDSELAARDWLKSDLAERSGVSATTIGRILMRRRNSIADASAHKIAGVLGDDFRTMLDIAEGRAVKQIGEGGGVYVTATDRSGVLAEWLRGQPAEVQEIIFATAKLHGFEKQLPASKAC